MTRAIEFLRKLRALYRREKLDPDIAEEVRHHLDEQTHHNLAAEMLRDEAHHAARRSCGGVEQIKERARDQRSRVWLGNCGRTCVSRSGG